MSMKTRTSGTSYTRLKGNMNFEPFNLCSLIDDNNIVLLTVLQVTAIVFYPAGISSQTGLTEYTSMLIRPRLMAVT